MKRVIGIDPGLSYTGWGVIEVPAPRQLTVLECGDIRTQPCWCVQDRLRKIHDGLFMVMERFSLSCAAIERTLVNINPKTSLDLCTAKGAIILTLSLCGIGVVEYAPKVIKKAVTGNGNADKLHVAKMLELMFPGSVISSSHAADALATAVTHALFSSMESV